jgi:hypothetical protein
VKVKASMPFEEIAIASRAEVEEEPSGEVSEIAEEIAEVEPMAEVKVATAAPGRRRRRAVSTGVVTPGA